MTLSKDISVGTIIHLGGVLVAMAIGWASIRERINALESAQKELTAIVTRQVEQQAAANARVTRIEEALEWIKRRQVPR